MNSPRIRHLVAPTMSVADRNLTITNEVRTIMTTAAVPLHHGRSSAGQGALEIAVSRLAVSMLRWSSRRANLRAGRGMDHERMVLTRANERALAEAVDYRYVARIL